MEGRCKMRTSNKYDEILSLPHHVSKTRPQMPMSDRAAQFAPFAALTGYDSAIKETGRLTDEKIELDEEALTALDMKYQLLMDAFDDAPEVTITFFQPDERKAGGKYASQVGVPALARPSSTFQQIEVVLPELSIQKRVVEIISTIQKKIANNQELNDNLAA